MLGKRMASVGRADQYVCPMLPVSPREAMAILIELNNRYALDGRNPNSYSGIFWVFGRYDRPWGPRRDVFGAIRYMTSDSALRKLRLKGYLARWGADPGLFVT